MRDEMNYQKVWKMLKITLLIFLSTLLIINLYIITAHIAFKNNLPKVVGFAQVIIKSGSMEPAINVGDMLIIHQQEGYQANDIVTFRSQRSLVTHRIISLKGNEVLTQGDTNNVADEPIMLSQIEGKVLLRIPKVGDFILLLKTPFGILIMTLGVIFLVEFPYLINRIKNPRR